MSGAARTLREIIDGAVSPDVVISGETEGWEIGAQEVPSGLPVRPTDGVLVAAVLTRGPLIDFMGMAAHRTVPVAVGMAGWVEVTAVTVHPAPLPVVDTAVAFEVARRLYRRRTAETAGVGPGVVTSAARLPMLPVGLVAVGHPVRVGVGGRWSTRTIFEIVTAPQPAAESAAGGSGDGPAP